MTIVHENFHPTLVMPKDLGQHASPTLSLKYRCVGVCTSMSSITHEEIELTPPDVWMSLGLACLAQDLVVMDNDVVTWPFCAEGMYATKLRLERCTVARKPEHPA